MNTTMSRYIGGALIALLCALALAPMPVAAQGEIEVTTTSGGSGGPDCTLRDAITAANTDTATGGCPAGSGADTILLSPAEYRLDQVDNSGAFGPNGLPVIDSAITIVGSGALLSRAEGTPFRFFQITANGRLTLDQLTLFNGRIVGADGRNGANGGSALGGAVYNQGELHMRNESSLRQNRAIGGNGGDKQNGQAGVGGLALGGAIYNDVGAELTIQSTSFELNGAQGGIGGTPFGNSGLPGGGGTASGGAIYNRDGHVTIAASAFELNSALGGPGGNGFGGSEGGRGFGNGGAIVNQQLDGTALLRIDQASFNRSIAGSGGAVANIGGTATIANVQMIDGFALQFGGAISANGGTVRVEQSNLAVNRSGLSGGAIHAERGDFSLSNSQVLSNSVDLNFGGGLFLQRGTFTIEGSTIAENRAIGGGGGIFAGSRADLQITNSTLSANQAGNAETSSEGGAILAAFAGDLRMSYSTIVSNTATVSTTGGIRVLTTTLTIDRSVLALNGAEAQISATAGATLTSGGYNRSTAAEPFLSQPTDAVIDNPELLPLTADETVHLPAPGSPLLNQIPAADCGETLSDQRGVLRPQGRNCDIGAIEVRVGDDANNAPLAVADNYTTAPGTALTIAAPGVLANDSDPNNEPLTAQLVLDPARGTLDLRADGSFTFTPEPGFIGVATFLYGASDGIIFSNIAPVKITVGNPADNAPPMTANDSFNTTADTILEIAAPGLLANDSDPNGDPLNVRLSVEPTNGEVTIHSDGGFSYMPQAGFSGSDSFAYWVSDGINDREATVTILVQGEPGTGPPPQRRIYLPLLHR